MSGSEDLKNELAKLASGLGRAELQDRWRRLYGTDPPEQISRPLLARAIGHRMQTKAMGGLSFPARRALERASEQNDLKEGRTSQERADQSGVVLVRVWHGETHQVTIVKDGVQYCGRRYRSLSEVARTITKTRWSGPRFFGLKAPEKKRVVR
jgi:hypothetical protein